MHAHAWAQFPSVNPTEIMQSRMAQSTACLQLTTWSDTEEEGVSKRSWKVQYIPTKS